MYTFMRASQRKKKPEALRPRANARGVHREETDATGTAGSQCERNTQKAGTLPWQHSLSTTPAFTAGTPMTLMTVDVLFHDEPMLRLAGITAELPQTVEVLAAAVPTTGDVLRFRGLNFQSGELAIFRVVSRAMLLGAGRTAGIQLNVELVVAHQP